MKDGVSMGRTYFFSTSGVGCVRSRFPTFRCREFAEWSALQDWGCLLAGFVAPTLPGGHSCFLKALASATGSM